MLFSFINNIIICSKHWFLAIICFPGLVGKVSTSAKKTIKNDAQKVVKKLKELKTKAVTIDSTITPVPTTITIDQLDDGSERDEGDDDEVEIDSDKEVKLILLIIFSLYYYYIFYYTIFFLL